MCMSGRYGGPQRGHPAATSAQPLVQSGCRTRSARASFPSSSGTSASKFLSAWPFFLPLSWPSLLPSRPSPRAFSWPCTPVFSSFLAPLFSSSFCCWPGMLVAALGDAASSPSLATWMIVSPWCRMSWASVAYTCHPHHSLSPEQFAGGVARQYPCNRMGRTSHWTLDIENSSEEREKKRSACKGPS